MRKRLAAPAALRSLARSGRWRPHSASRLLAQALRELGRLSEWRRAHCELSIVRDVSLGLARYLTLFVPSRDGQRLLLAQRLAGGLDGWSDAAGARSSFDRYHAYLRGPLGSVPKVLECVVCIRCAAGETYWYPMLCGLLDCWREAGGVVEVSRRARPRDSTYVDVALAEFRFLVLVRFLARREMRLAPLAPHFSELVCRYG